MLEIREIEVGSQKAQLMRGHKTLYWQLRLSIGGKRKQVSTKCKDEAAAKDFAMEWMAIAKGREAEDRPITGTSFKRHTKKFLAHEEITKASSRNDRHISEIRNIVNRWLIPFFQRYA